MMMSASAIRFITMCTCQSFMFRNDHLIEKTVEITVAKLSNTSTPTNESNGKNVAEFMQEIYDKLVELNKED